ncbi:MAG: Uma2 family endonuclease [Acetobacteraceae bacterium]|nr:Uma2 family endonuclease [Acetobacteraceae bacterium]
MLVMASEQAQHARIRARVYRALDDAVRLVGIPCEVFPDGMSVPVADDAVFEPDALLRCGDPLPDDALKITDPVVVVEVASTSTRGLDAGSKLAGYVRLASLRHYLILDGRLRVAIHHVRDAQDGPITTRILREGPLALDPPGIVIDAAALFGPSQA